MNVDTIKMSEYEARRHHDEYVASVKRLREKRQAELQAKAKAAGKALGAVRVEKSQMEKEDEELKKLFHTLAKGTKVISLPQVFRKSGVDTKQFLPLFAIAAADARFCRLEMLGTTPRFYWGNSSWSSHFKQAKYRIDLPSGTFPLETSDDRWRKAKGLLETPVRAVVPAIPPRFRPDNLDGYFIFWEAVWEKAPPVDPILLKKITATTYAIVAQWDLTPAEQMILEGRFS
jgi:hypothetical protein